MVITNITDEWRDGCRQMRDECKRVKTSEGEWKAIERQKKTSECEWETSADTCR